MSFSVNTNITSLQAQNYLRQTSDFQSKTINKVTSGLRIVQSGDDAAGLAVANGYRSDEAVLTQGVRNANDGLSTLQTADGGMSNISTLLDRARTLATQSASDTFTGDRSTLNSEFQSVVSEITRQATNIGLNTGGTLAKSLGVFIGGGQSSGTGSAITNGSVGINLTKSTVDAQSLGLKGVQAEGNTAVDISAGHATSVQNILANTANKAAISNGSTTVFTFAGAGFSDQSKVSISVNLASVTDPNTLVTAVNTAIQNAGNGSTSSATAFKNAGITANVVTDSTGSHLAFSSSTTAFQVGAGDQVSNALLGNTLSATDSTGKAVSTTLTGGSATLANANTTGTTGGVAASDGGGVAGAAKVTVRISGASVAGASGANYVDIKLDGSTGNNTLDDLKSLVNNNAALKTAGISLTTATAGSALVFTSATGEKINVQTVGDNANVLGLGAYDAVSGSTFDYSSVTGTDNSAVAAKATLSGSFGFNFSLNGVQGQAASIQGTVPPAGTGAAAAVTAGTVDTSAVTGGNSLTLKVNGGAMLTVDFADDVNKSALNAGESVANIASYINQVAKRNGIQGTIASVTGTGTSASLVLQSDTAGSNSSIQVTGGGAAFGFSSTTAVNGTGPNQIDLQSLNTTGTSGAVTTTAAVGGGYGAGTLDITVDGGAAQTVTITAAATDAGKLADQLNKQLVGATATVTAAGILSITSNSKGATSGVAVAADGSDAGGGAALVGALTAATGTGAANSTISATAAVNLLNQAFSTDSSLQAAGLKATVEGTAGATKIQIASTNGTYFRTALNAESNNELASTYSNTAAALGWTTSSVSSVSNNAAATANSTVVNSGGASQSADLSFAGLVNGTDSQTITIAANDSSGNTQSLGITLQNNATTGIQNARTIDETINTINSALQQSNVATLQNVVAVKDNTGGNETIKFLSTDTSFTVAVGNNGANGVGGKGTSTASSVVGTGSTADISTQLGASNAVTALSKAVTLLGDAQAVVGKGENQLNYAVNLAQSQLTNEASAESRIRDADLASEAANLTKAQILVQAGVAALAQANSAPQQVLSLLKG